MAQKSKKTNDPPDLVQEAMGIIGPWQIFLCFLLSFVNIPEAWHQTSIDFIAPKYKPVCNFSTVDDKHIYHNMTSDMDKTIVSEFDLFGDKKWLASLVQSITMLGILLGNILFGALADKIGRKNPLVIAVVVQSVAGVLSAVMPSYELFFVFKLISAIATGGTMLVSFALLMEIIGIEWRSTISVIFHIPFVIGGVLLIPMAQYWKEWRPLLLTMCIPPIALVSYYWLIPESPRWLLAVGKMKEARKVLEAAAKKNNIPLEKVNIAIQFHENQEVGETKEQELRTYGVLDLFRTPNLRIRTLCIAFNWFVCGMCYFGVFQYASRLEGLDLFTTCYILALSVLPGVLIALGLINRVSRLKLLMGGNVVAGLSLLATLYTPKEVHLFFASVGVCGMSVCFPTIYLYTGELFPTVVRNVGLGLCSVATKIACMIAPFIATSDTNEDRDPCGAQTGKENWLAPLVFGIGPLIGACLCLILPDTKDCKLPETIEDGENFGKKNRNTPIDAGT